MPSTLAPSPVAAHLLRSDPRAAIGRADLRKAEAVADLRAAVGACVERARCLVGWSLKELADAVARDERQVARWISGAERAQMDALLAVDALRGPLVIALAELTHDIEVVTEIRVRRSA